MYEETVVVMLIVIDSDLANGQSPWISRIVQATSDGETLAMDC